jgi:glycosyltransferase 2 family protein
LVEFNQHGYHRAGPPLDWIKDQRALTKAIAQLRSGIEHIFTGFLKSRRLPFITAMGLLTTGILGWLIYRQRNLFLNFEWEFRPLPIIFSLIFYSLCLFQVAYIWSSIMNSLGGKIKFRQHFRYFCISLLGKRLPGTVWYIPWRAKMYDSMGISLGQVSIASGIELAVSIISGLMVAFIFALSNLYKYQVSFWSGAVLLVLCLLALHPAVIHRVGKWIKIELEKIKYSSILSWIIQYAFFWIVSGVMIYCILNIFFPTPISQITYVIGAWSLTGALSLSLFILPSNFGFTELSLSVLLSFIIPSPVAVIVAIGVRIIIFTYELCWAGAMILREYLEGRKITR